MKQGPMRQIRGFGLYVWRHRIGSTEGCTGVPDFDFVDCCNAHDKHYELHDVTRKQADDELYDCIAARGHPNIAWIYWSWVRAFGWIAWAYQGPTPPDGTAP